MSTTDGPLIYRERGATWWPVLWGPAFVTVGAVIEQLTPGPKHLWMWLVVGLALALGAFAWVRGRRKVCTVSLSPEWLVLGHEHVAVSRIVRVGDVGAPVGARVLGGGWTVPKGTHEVPLELDEGVVLAWARDPEALVEELSALITPAGTDGS